MRRLLRLFALLFATPLNALPWDGVKINLHANYPFYDECFRDITGALLTWQEPTAINIEWAQAGAKTIVSWLPLFIQYEGFSQPKYKNPIIGSEEDLQKVRHSREVKEQKWVLSGAVQLWLTLQLTSKKTWSRDELLALGQFVGPAMRVLNANGLAYPASYYEMHKRLDTLCFALCTETHPQIMARVQGMLGEMHNNLQYRINYSSPASN